MYIGMNLYGKYISPLNYLPSPSIHAGKNVYYVKTGSIYIEVPGDASSYAYKNSNNDIYLISDARIYYRENRSAFEVAGYHIYYRDDGLISEINGIRLYYTDSKRLSRIGDKSVLY